MISYKLKLYTFQGCQCATRTTTPLSFTFLKILFQRRLTSFIRFHLNRDVASNFKSAVIYVHFIAAYFSASTSTN